MMKFDELLSASKLGELLHKEQKEEKKCNTILIVLAVIGAIAAVAGIAYAVYRYFHPVVSYANTMFRRVFL